MDLHKNLEKALEQRGFETSKTEAIAGQRTWGSGETEVLISLGGYISS